MCKRKLSTHPEIYCDFNARMTERGFSLERRGSVDDLSKLGLTLEAAVGRRFVFIMYDEDDNGQPNDIMFDGCVVFDNEWGYLAIMDEGTDVYWRSDIVDDASPV